MLYVPQLDDSYENLQALVCAEDLWVLSYVFRLHQSFAEDQWDPSLAEDAKDRWAAVYESKQAQWYAA